MECYYFGTFDPVHLGHIKTAKKVLSEFNFDKVVFVPAFARPIKIIVQIQTTDIIC